MVRARAVHLGSTNGDSTGLGGMKDRVALYGGRLLLESGKDGTRLEAVVPIPGEAGILRA